MREALLYAVLFILPHLLLILIANVIPIEQTDFALKENPKDYFPAALYALAGFDGAHYLLIAKRGYEQFQQAFFPLYPFLISILTKLTRFSVLLSGIIISWLPLALGIFFFKKFSRIISDNDRESGWPILFLLSFPSAFFYVTVYPESLFLFLSSGALYFIFRKNYLVAGVFAVLSSLTKLQGVFLVIPFIISIIQPKNFSVRNLFLAFSPAYGLLIYSFYLAKNYGDPLLFYHAQEKFGAERTSQGIILLPQVLFRYLKILTGADINFQYWVALLELSIFSIVISVLLFDLYKIIKNKTKNFNYLSVNLYSIVVLILPTLTGTLSSLPRYALLSFGFFIALVKIKSMEAKIAIAIIFGIIQAVLFIFFIKGHFVS